jgi:hypothetical protein
MFLPYSVGPLLSGVTDSERRRAYFATDSQPSKVVALDLDSMEVVDSIELEEGEDAPLAAHNRCGKWRRLLRNPHKPGADRSCGPKSTDAPGSSDPGCRK